MSKKKNKAKAKGDALEKAVEAIEALILASSPALKGGSYLIESKKLLKVDGVPHEIDLYVTVDMGNLYKAVFIFECKNWEEAVGKNEIIIFAQKVKVAQAQKGFFIAKSFTQGAEAQAKQPPSIELILAAEKSAQSTQIPFNFHLVDKKDMNVETIIEFRKPENLTSPLPLRIQTKEAILNGEKIDTQAFIRKWMDEESDKDLKTQPTSNMPEGIVSRSLKVEKKFSAESMYIDGLEVERMHGTMHYSFMVIRPVMLAYFDVATRGHYITFSPVFFGGQLVQIDFTFLQNAKTNFKTDNVHFRLQASYQ